MAQKHLASEIFGVVQGALLVVIAGSAALFYWARKQRNEGNAPNLENLNLSRPGRVSITPSNKQNEPAETPAKPLELESALPIWDKNTPAHEILGVHAAADEAAIESAYRALLKKYHPDRFAAWGKGYQTRAHHVILLIQDARDRMRGKR